MWKNRDSYLVDTFKHSTISCQNNLVSSSLWPNNSGNTSSIYEGDEFDVGKEGMSVKTPSLASLYSTEQATPQKNLCINDGTTLYKASDILIRSRHIYKRGQLEALLNHTKIIKKRKVNTMDHETPDSVGDDMEMTTDSAISTTTDHTGIYNNGNNVFLQSKTAAANTPIASMFCAKSTDRDIIHDAAYY
ncbi:hypothetical protein BDF20DRAFT_887890 [Mycotypha africana]|uniref:uncharacterized protein n=1 Tax=Mycotypha africana TaxID=64632 RepID=UPI002301C2E4|nr:uncharacterized protein BDF20DRAFT_887890 [Mycotypha africana]KAI8972004.1 hypothetical protein BDF20DRAFT_887890 [Mycotypha africana]